MKKSLGVVFLLCVLALSGCFSQSSLPEAQVLEEIPQENTIKNEDQESEKNETEESQEMTNPVIYRVVPEESTFKWAARKIVGAAHEGEANIAGGQITMNGEKVIAAGVRIDMNTITSTDLEDPNSNEKLVGHLKSADFFDVENFPETTFLITEVREKADSAGNTHEVFGNLKIKETTRLINFPAVIEVSETEVRALAAFSIDRTLWDVRFGSDKFFDNLGDGAIDNFFDVKVNLLAKIES